MTRILPSLLLVLLGLAGLCGGAQAPAPLIDANAFNADPDAQEFLSNLKEYDLDAWNSNFAKDGFLCNDKNAKITLKEVPQPHSLSIIPCPPDPGTEFRAGHVDGHFRYKLKGEYALLVGSAGFNNDLATPPTPLVIFSILGDKKELWTSDKTKTPDKAFPFSVDITGVQILELRITVPKMDHTKLTEYRVVWFEPKVVRPPPIGTSTYKRLAGLAQKVRAAQDLGKVLKTLRQKKESKTPAEAEEAQMMLDALAGWAQRQIDQANQLKEKEPLDAVLALERLAAKYAGDELGATAKQAAEEIKRDPKIKLEYEGEKAWLQIVTMNDSLLPFQGERAPQSTGFRKKNADGIAAICHECEKLMKKFPNTVASRKAEDLIGQYH
jgi:hypothetical protein